MLIVFKVFLIVFAFAELLYAKAVAAMPNALFGILMGILVIGTILVISDAIF